MLRENARRLEESGLPQAVEWRDKADDLENLEQTKWQERFLQVSPISASSKPHLSPISALFPERLSVVSHAV